MKDISFVVESIHFLTPDVFRLKLACSEKLSNIRGGQFLNLAVPNGAFLLRRPFCIYEWDCFSVTLIIAIVGKGTKQLSLLKKGDSVKAVLPLGNGFILPDKYKKVALVGGGVGCAPLFPVVKDYPQKQFKAYIGFPSKDKVLFYDEFKNICDTTVATDDASFGEGGFVTDVFCKDIASFEPDVVLTCGAVPMLRALKDICQRHNLPAFMTGEAHMACGVGACLVCTCAVMGKDKKPHNLRACADGPVFNLEDVVL